MSGILFQLFEDMLMSLANVTGLVSAKPANTQKISKLSLACLGAKINSFSMHQHLQICVLLTHTNNYVSQQSEVLKVVILP